MKKTVQSIFLSTAVLAGTLLCSCSGSDYEAPCRLRCEHQEGNDVVIDTQTPRLSWINASEQASYQILVATSEDLLSEGNADVWDSGKTAGSESNLVPYSGPVMQSMEEYWWTVRTWDADGKVSAWAEPARWTAGMFSESDWKALWTGASWQDDGAPEADNSAPMFRKEFAVRSGLERATAFVCGLGWFEMTVNGRKVGEDFFVPGLTDYSARPSLEYNRRIPLDPKVSAYRTLYLAYDLTGMLTKGANAVSMLLGNGYYHEGMYNEYKIENYGCPKFICQIKLEYSDGTSELVCSDTSWKEAHSPIISNNLYQGEIYDAGMEIAGWDKAGFNDSSYGNAVLKRAPDGKLTANMGPVDRVVETLKPVSFEQLEDGSYRVDFGKVVTGWVRFDGMQMFGKDTLRVSFPSEYPAQGKYEYISASDGEVHYSPKFNWYVFREAIVKGAVLLDASQIVAEVVNSDVRPCAEFSSSNKLFEDIERIWRQSQTDNMHAGVASDCPHREKLPYTGDGEIAMPMVIANLDAESFYNKWIGDVLGSQNPETGHVPNGAPWEPWCGGGPAWGAAVCVMPWEFYCRYGDRDLLAKSLLPMKEYVRYMESWKVADGTVEVRKTKPSGEDCYWYNLGDWAPAFELPKDELVHTFIYWLCADLTSKAAEALGDGATAASYAKKAAEARDAFHRRYYDPKAGGYGDFGGNVYALYMGVPEDRLDEVRNSLRKEIMETHGGHVNVGFIAHRFLYEVLADNGMNDVAWTILNKKDFPSFGWQLENGATTTWELWSGNNCSLNHPMFGGGLIWFYKMLAGVRTDPSEPGFRHIIIRPVPAAEQGCVSYSIDTPYGKLRSQVTVEGGKVLMEGEIPFGSHATVYVPRSLDAAVKRPLDEDSYEVYKLGPGHYEFKNDKSWALGPFTRPVNRAVICPDTTSVFNCPMTKNFVKWRESDTFNPAATTRDGKICVLFRSEDRTATGIGSRTSRVGYAESRDGITMYAATEPVLFPSDDDMKDLDWPGGCEDPRVVLCPDGTYVMTYTSWNRDKARLCIATSADLKTWKKEGFAFGDAMDGKLFDDWSKSGSIVTKLDKNGNLVADRIKGKYLMYWGEEAINLATSKDLIHWTPTLDKDGNLLKIVEPRESKFDSQLTECGPPAVHTKDGIVLIYNGKSNETGTYSAGQILFDAKDPTKVLDRLDKPFLVPETDFEKSGQYKDGTVFCEGLVHHGDKWYLYYGCADSMVGVAVWSPDSGKKPGKKFKGIIVTGQNNHNWPVSHIALKKILDNSGMFETELAVSPAPGEDFSGFNVDFGKYDFVLLDYNGDSWNEEMKGAFLDYVNGGGGVIVYHAADNAFSGWKEFNEIIALGGWENRNENSGPYAYWKDGGLIKDMTPGPGGSHGYQHEYVLENRSGNPVTEGLPERWKHGRDELYDSMRGPGNIGELLYTAYSPKEMRGSGKTEPLIFTVDYGKARIFHIMLGHAGGSLDDNPAMQCTGFQTMILRGAEWCATGKVTQPVPADFPDDEMVSFRPEYR